MPYVEDENGNHITDENGNKIEYTVSYEETDFVYVHREPIYINSDGHLDTEERNIKVKDATDGSHAVSKNQLDTQITSVTNNLTKQLENSITTSANNLQSKLTSLVEQSIPSAIKHLKTEITTQIQESMKTHEAKIVTQMLNFRNEQIKNRIQRKYLTIPKKVHTCGNFLTNQMLVMVLTI